MLFDLTDRQIQYGTTGPLPERLTLRAGDLTCVYEAGFLRYIKVGGTEVVRYVYIALRDQQWNTVAPIFSNVQIDQQPDRFHITYTCEHQQGDIHFRWQGEISGGADSVITFTMHGEALSSFLRNRIGFCVLHPASCAGQSVDITHTDGLHEQTAFPDRIAPDTVFTKIRAMRQNIIGGMGVEVLFGGETFETEDQRNWSDASFKTYSTELALPFPVQVQPGDRVDQSVTIRLINDQHIAIPSPDEQTKTIKVQIDPSKIVGKLPGIGLSTGPYRSSNASDSLNEGKEDDRIYNAIKLLQLAHLHFTFHTNLKEVVQLRDTHIMHGLIFAREIGLPLQMSVIAYGETDSPPNSFAPDWISSYGRLDSSEPLDLFYAVFMFLSETYASTPDLIAYARSHYSAVLAVNAFGGGTDSFFTDLNRKRPQVEAGDLVAFSITPQVHAFDNATIVETLPIYRDQLNNARVLYPDHRFAVGPITLKMRYNPAAGGDFEQEPGQLPPNVDVRQTSLFGAGWLTVALRYLSEGGAEAVTFGDTHGYNGVMQDENGSPLPDLFPSLPSGVYPMYHVLRTLADWRGADAVQIESDDPLSVDGLALRLDARNLVIVVNFTRAAQDITLGGIGRITRYCLLDTPTARQYANDPEGFAALSQSFPSQPFPSQPFGAETNTDGGLALMLPPFALAFIEFDQA